MHKEKLGLWQLTSLVIGNLVGSSIFLLPATLAAIGSLSIISWIVTALGAITLALIFAELAHHIPKQGGPYAFVRHTFGNSAGFFIAWGYWILAWLSNAALIAGAVSYLTIIAGGLSGTQALLIQLSILFLVTIFNLYGLKTTGMAEMIITIIKVIPLLIIPFFALAKFDTNNFPPVLGTQYDSHFTAMNAAAFIALWGFVGLETGTVPGGSVVNPRKNIPLATVLGTATAAFIYVFSTIAIFGVMPHADLAASQAPYADAAALIFGGAIWSKIIAVCAVVTCIGSLNGWIMIVGRIAQAAADDGLFPKVFSKTTEAGTPYAAILISSILTVPFVVLSTNNSLMEQFNFIIDVSVTFYIFIYLSCVFVFAKTVLRGNKAPFSQHLIFIVGMLFLIWALFATKLTMLMYSASIILFGIPVRIYMRYKSK